MTVVSRIALLAWAVAAGGAGATILFAATGFDAAAAVAGVFTGVAFVGLTFVQLLR